MVTTRRLEVDVTINRVAAVGPICPLLIVIGCLILLTRVPTVPLTPRVVVTVLLLIKLFPVSPV